MLEVFGGTMIIQPMENSDPAVAEWLQAKTTVQWRGESFQVKPIEKSPRIAVIGLTNVVAHKRAAMARNRALNSKGDSKGYPWLPVLS